jgi:hypothetical protein
MSPGAGYGYVVHLLADILPRHLPLGWCGTAGWLAEVEGRAAADSSY